jgi:hypothetical protein
MNMLNKQCEQSTKGGPPTWRLREGLISPCHKKKTACYKMLHRSLDGFFGMSKRQGSEEGPVEGSCENGNEALSSIKKGGWDFLTDTPVASQVEFLFMGLVNPTKIFSFLQIQS